MRKFGLISALAALLALSMVAGCCASNHNPKVCPGDCNGDGKVMVVEVVLAGEIAASNAPLSDCKAADQNGDGKVTADEVSAASNASVNGCK